MPNLADRLQYIRQIKNLSQAELAEIAGTTQQAIQQAEKGKARQPRYLHNLAMALDLSIEWVLFGTEEKISTTDLSGFSEKSAEVLDNFFAMPEEDQELIFKLMKSRQKNDADKS
ncbi:MAG: helix-turn-helix domain-containing protein [Alphaproteobacteria bacterium]|nr:helix-turn-helix domain-containing protein [Alphaproteobacteria bacterium]